MRVCHKLGNQGRLCSLKALLLSFMKNKQTTNLADSCSRRKQRHNPKGLMNLVSDGAIYRGVQRSKGARTDTRCPQTNLRWKHFLLLGLKSLERRQCCQGLQPWEKGGRALPELRWGRGGRRGVLPELSTPRHGLSCVPSLC